MHPDWSPLRTLWLFTQAAAGFLALPVLLVLATLALSVLLRDQEYLWNAPRHLANGVLAVWLVLAVSDYIKASSPSWTRAVAKVIRILTAVSVVAAVLGLPMDWSLVQALDAASRLKCTNNLRQIGFALQNYHLSNGVYPPAVVRDRAGRPMQSWRALLLPYLGADPSRQFRLEEPWDGTTNAGLRDTLGHYYKCPSNRDHDRAATQYLAIVGATTAFAHLERSKLSSGLPGGIGQKIVVAEVPGKGHDWREPVDLDLDGWISLVQSAARGQARANHSGGFLAVHADGSVAFVPLSTPPDRLREMVQMPPGMVNGKTSPPSTQRPGEPPSACQQQIAPAASISTDGCDRSPIGAR